MRPDHSNLERTHGEGVIGRLTADQWSGVLCSEHEIDYPTWHDVVGAIRGMDAKTRTMVCLFGADDATLSIGGDAGRHVILLTTAAASMWTLLSPERAASEIELLNVGGQEGDYPANQVVCMTLALRAAADFRMRNGKGA